MEKLRVLLPLSFTEILHGSSLWPQNSIDLLENTLFFSSGFQNRWINCGWTASSYVPL